MTLEHCEAWAEEGGFDIGVAQDFADLEQIRLDLVERLLGMVEKGGRHGNTTSVNWASDNYLIASCRGRCGQRPSDLFAEKSAKTKESPERDGPAV